MANYSTLIAAIQSAIAQNGSNAITGPILQQVLLSMVASLGADYQFIGKATTETNPGTPDQNVAYIVGPGTYPNFNAAVVPDGYIGILKYNGTWHNATIAVGRDFSTDIETSKILLSKSAYGTYYTIPNDGVPGSSFTKRDVSNAKFVLISSYMDNDVRVMLRFYDADGNALTDYDVKQGDCYLDAATGNYEKVVAIPVGATKCAAGKLNIGSRTVYLKVVPDVTTILNDARTNITNIQTAISNVVLQYVAQSDNTPFVKYQALKDFANQYARSAYGKKYSIPEERAADPRNTRRDVEGAQFVFISTYVDNDVRKMLAFLDSGGNELTDYSVVQNYGLLNPATNCYEICVPVPASAKYCVGGKVNAGERTVYLKVINGDAFIDEIANIQSLLNTLDFVAIKAKTDEFTIIPSDTTNLMDPNDFTIGYIYGSNGRYYDDDNYMVTGYIPITAGTQYTVLCKSWSSTYYYRHVRFYNSAKVGISGITSQGKTFTAPENAAFVRVSVFRKPNDSVIPTADYGLFVGASPTFEDWYGDTIEIPFVPYELKTDNAIVTKADLEANKGDTATKKLTITVTLPNVKIEDKNGNYVNVATNYRQSRGDSVFASENLFNFLNTSFNGHSRSSKFKDDIAPAHFLNTTLGANHAQPCYDATISSHGLTNVDVGTAWVKGSTTYYIVAIIDANTVRFISQNSGTSQNPSFTSLTSGTITRNGTSLTISSVADAQMHPATKNHSIRIVVDGKTEISENGKYYADQIEFVESYDIMNPVSVLQNIINNAGSSSEPVYDGDVAAHVENVYRFLSNMAVLVIANFTAKQPIAFQDLMFSQAAIIGTSGTVKYYLPNSAPIDGYDMTQPLAINWSSVANSLYPGTGINRVLQFDGTHGFAIGFNTSLGVGKNLANYTDASFELRRGSGKVYPHGVHKNVVGATLPQNRMYGAIMYRCPFIPETTGNRISMYYYELSGATYVYVDYKGSQFDTVVVDDKLNGKEITVVESKNAELCSDIYNGGFAIDAQFISGQTCYIVVKIS